MTYTKTHIPAYIMTPKKYKNAVELQKVIDNYFQNPINIKIIVDEKGNENHIPVYTITGLCMALNFKCRQSIYDWKARVNDSNKDNREMAELIVRAAKFIESNYESNLQYGQANGAIFALKNMDWQDKTDHTHSGNVNIGYNYKQNANVEDFSDLGND